MNLPKRSLSLVRKNLLLFVVIILLEFLFFVSASGALYTYSQAIVEPLKHINTYLTQQRWMQELPTEKNLQELNIPATDLGLIDAEKQKMLFATLRLYFSLSLLFIAFLGLVWACSYRIVHLFNAKEFLRSYGKFAAVAAIFLLVLFGLLHATIVLAARQFFLPDAAQTYFFMLPLFLGVMVLYFMPVAFALLPRSSLRNTVRETVQYGIRKCMFLFLLYGIVVVVVTVLAIAMFLLLEKSFVASLLLGLLLLAMIAYARIALIVGLTEHTKS
jgi:hypothetical protein